MIEDRKGFGDVVLSPGDELRLILFPFLAEGFEGFFGVCEVRAVEDGFDLCSDGAFELLLGDVVLRVLLEMELATLPGGGV